MAGSGSFPGAGSGGNGGGGAGGGGNSGGAADAALADAADSGSATEQDAQSDAPDAAEPIGPDAGRNFSTDRDDFFGAARCAQAGVELCDGFEAGAVGAAPDQSVWATSAWGGGTAKIDDVHAARGGKAVHIHNPAGGAQTFMTETKTFLGKNMPLPNNQLFGRMFLYVATVPAPFKWDDQAHFPLVHWTAAAATGNYAANNMTYRPQVRAIGGINEKLLINVDGGPDAEQARDDQAPAGHETLPQDQWVCFEFQYSGTGADAELRVWWDGVEHEHMHLDNSNPGNEKPWPIPSYDELSFGWATYQNYSAVLPNGFDVWLDEIAVDRERIGCAL